MVLQGASMGSDNLRLPDGAWSSCMTQATVHHGEAKPGVIPLHWKPWSTGCPPSLCLLFPTHPTQRTDMTAHGVDVHFVTDLANLLTDHRMSGRPVLARYKHFQTICEQTCDNSPVLSNSSSFIWWSSKQGLDTLCNCSVFLLVSPPFHAFSRMTPPYRLTTLTLLNANFPTPAIVLLLQQKYLIRTFFVCLNNFVILLAFTLSAP